MKEWLKFIYYSYYNDPISISNLASFGPAGHLSVVNPYLLYFRIGVAGALNIQ